MPNNTPLATVHQFLSYKTILPSLFFLLIVFLLLYDPYKPIHPVNPPPTLADDLDRQSLLSVLSSQRHYLQSSDAIEKVALGDFNIPKSWLLSSVTELLEFVTTNPNDAELSQFLIDRYDFFQAGGRKDKWGRKMLVTGYYEPLFEGSLTASPPYQYPLFGLPHQLIVQEVGEGSQRIGRLDSNGKLIPFWTREEIESEQHLAGSELVYLKDPFDAFLLHVQGSGKIQFPDGVIRSIGFAGSNGHEYVSIGKILVERNIMKLKDVDVPAIRKYLKDNPEKLKALLHENPRYIFFQWKDDKGPVGSSGETLTAGRSIAIDPQSLPTGTIAFLESERPKIIEGKIDSWVPMRRLVFPQDTGSAIRGTGRVDMFWGRGNYAEIAANHMKHPGKLYFLIKKGFIGNPGR